MNSVYTRKFVLLCIQMYSYPGLVLKFLPHSTCFVLSLTDQFLQCRGIIFPQGKAHIFQEQQNQFNVLFRERANKLLQNVKDQQRMHDMEVIQMGNQDKEVFTFFPFSLTFIEFIKFLYYRLQKVCTNLAKKKNITSKLAYGMHAIICFKQQLQKHKC